MADLRNVHVACLATEGYEQPELTEPVKALRDAGAVVDIVSEKRGPVRGFKHHDPGDSVEATLTFDDVQPDRYDAVLLPGGAINADYIRAIPSAQRFVSAMNEAGKPMAVICHAPWMLVETGIAKGRTMTSWPSIRTDVKNAGGNWVDREVCVDANLVTSRKPDDIPAFNREFVRLIEEAKGRSASGTASQTGAATQGARM